MDEVVLVCLVCLSLLLINSLLAFLFVRVFVFVNKDFKQV